MSNRRRLASVPTKSDPRPSEPKRGLPHPDLNRFHICVADGDARDLAVFRTEEEEQALWLADCIRYWLDANKRENAAVLVTDQKRRAVIHSDPEGWGK